MDSLVGKGPLQQYQEAIEDDDVQQDDVQLQTVRHLQTLYEELLAPAPRPRFLARWFPGTGAVGTKPPKGLYLWGGVGRGKTYLMDLFYESLPMREKSRTHFHRFMRSVHIRLRELQGEKDPLQQVALEFSNRYRILCFDEFFVSDITDAMILATILDVLLARGVVLVATSNIEPAHLYENGLQRRKFLPAIELIETNTSVLNVDGGIDYRLRALEMAEIYHFPLDEAADKGLMASFMAISPDEGMDGIELDIENRSIRSRRCGDGVAWFEFDDICAGPRSQNDYIELARIFQTILISNVPCFGYKTEDKARRFISLVDELYDRNVKLILSAAEPAIALYQGELLEFEFQRTQSRLQEMQSHEYLAREHKP
jgi:cell division protein ZapE|tara:strand:- start:11399 stop:12511 length:1113 start_codon:yes stop_codon:yes gene_type:complete